MNKPVIAGIAGNNMTNTSNNATETGNKTSTGNQRSGNQTGTNSTG